ncbi:MAG: hypothetical protein V4459_09200 [Pseudomonadota bacterium]
MKLPSSPGIRVLTTLALMIVGYCAVSRSFASAWANVDPVAAFRFSGQDARINARAALVMMQATKTASDREAAARLAGKSFQRDGTAVPAAVALGFYSALANDDNKGAAWFDYSEKLSRRDLPTQLYFIEKSVGDGDVGRALYHYDVALRTSESAGQTLYPVLKNALADPGIQMALAKTLARKPLWAPGFIGDVASTGPDYAAAAQLFIKVRRLKGEISPTSDVALISNLIAHGNMPVAWSYYTTIHPDAAGKLIRNADFNATRDLSSPFDWQLSSGDGVTADFSTIGDVSVLDYRLSPTVASEVAQQLVFLPAGKYRLVSTVIESSQPVGSGPFWELRCTDGRSLGKLELGQVASGVGRFAAEVIVPPDCAAQALVLTVRASDDVQGASGQVDSVSMARVN